MNPRSVDLGSGNVRKLMFSLALPTILSQIVNMLYNLVDRVYIGHMQPVDTVGALALTGVGVCLPVILIISAFAALLAMGGAPRASIFEGRGEPGQSERIMGNSFTLLVCISLVLTVLLQLFAEPLLLLFGASENTIGYALSYLKIYSLGTICVQMTLGMNAYITAQGFTTVSMKTVLIGAILNTILDPIFIFVLDMGARGAALATILSQTVSALWVLRFLTGSTTRWRLRRENLRPVPAVFLPSLALGLSPFIMQSTESLIAVCFNSSLLKYGGDIAVGCMTVLISIMQLAMMPLQGLTQGAQPIVSYNFGARNAQRVRDAFKTLLTACLTYSLVLWAAVQLFRRQGPADLHGCHRHFRHSDRLPADVYCPGQCQDLPVPGGPAEDHSADPPDLYSAPLLCQQSHCRVSGGTGSGSAGRRHNRHHVLHPVQKEHGRAGEMTPIPAQQKTCRSTAAGLFCASISCPWAGSGSAAPPSGWR